MLNGWLLLVCSGWARIMCRSSIDWCAVLDSPLADLLSSTASRRQNLQCGVLRTPPFLRSLGFLFPKPPLGTLVSDM
jgi:hypothetical protein